MGVSAVGQGIKMSTVRYTLATILVFVSLFYYFYGPPITAMMSRAAQDECNGLTGSSYRGYRLEWKSTTLTQVSLPHWECYDLRTDHQRAVDLGWWVDL